jgi:hypothetical protein
MTHPNKDDVDDHKTPRLPQIDHTIPMHYQEVDDGNDEEEDVTDEGTTRKTYIRNEGNDSDHSCRDKDTSSQSGTNAHLGTVSRKGGNRGDDVTGCIAHG